MLRYLTFFFLSMTFSASAQASYNLDSAFEVALKRNERISIQSARLEQAEERFRRAKGSFFPTIEGVASYTRLPDVGQSSAFNKPDRPEVKVTASQALFRGFREFAGLRLAESNVATEMHAREATAADLYRDLAENFYTILTLEQDAKNLEIQIDLSKKRASELTSRKKIGRSRASEVLSVQVALANLQSQLADAQAQINAAREQFSLLAGIEKDSKLVDGSAFKRSGTDFEIAPLVQYLKRVEKRPDIAAVSSQVQGAEDSVSVARGMHLPAIDVFGNYYFKRTGVNEGQDWDFTAKMTLPIFSGGTIVSQVAEAASQQKEAEKRLSLARREAEQEVSSLWEFAVTNKKQLVTLKQALELAEKNYRIHDKEYSLGLVSNLDVLQALNSFHEARRNYDRARFAFKLSVIRLEVASALRPVWRDGEI